MKLIWRTSLLTFTLLVACSTTAMAQSKEDLPAKRTLVRITAIPAKMDLTNKFDYRQVLLTGTLDNGETLDVTRMVQVIAPDVVKVSEQGQVRPVKDGQGKITFSMNGKSVDVPVTVSGQTQEYQVSFVRDVMPIMSKIGCNAGTCHGSAKGKNGFSLSLRGYDALADHRSLTDDLMGRRFDRSAPDRSLMLLKITGEVPHVGGVLTKTDDPYYRVLHSWIADGVKYDPQTTRVKSIEVFPKGVVIPLPEMKQQMRVVATYNDGSTRDVTAEAFIESSNTEVAKVDKTGLVEALRRGETAMLARYEGKYAASSVIVMGDREGFAWKPVQEYNHIDTLVYEKLKSVKVLPSEVCTDADFVRRVNLDLTGLPPTSKQVRDFLNIKTESKAKREALVDQLIGSKEFVEHWTNKWADLLQVNAKFLGANGAKAYRDWIRKSVEANKPYDQFAREVLTAEGSNMKNPAAAYWKILRKPQEAMENTTHLFLAVRFNCNKCHDHPFERWTQDQYYEMSAFFAQVGRKADPKYGKAKIGGTAVEGAKPLVEIIYDQANGEVRHDKTGQVTPPEFPFMSDFEVKDAKTRREKLARWITSAENPYFAKSYVNRIWSYLMGVGLIEPVDDIRAGNPPTNPKLLDRLTEDFIKSGFDTQKLMRTICKSRAYQHSIKTNTWNEDDEINYSHALARRLPAEVLFDAIHKVTGATPNIPGLPAGARAAEIVDPRVKIPGEFLKLLGQPARESSCECERTNSMLLGPVLTLVNGPVISDAIADPNNHINKLVASQKDDAKVVEELFVAILNRPPTAAEVKLGVTYLKGNRDEFNKMSVRKAQLQKAYDDHVAKLDKDQIKWESEFKKTAVWHPIDVASFSSKSKKTTFKKLEDRSILVQGDNVTPELYVVTANTDVKGITGVRLEVLPDDSLPGKGPGRADNGNFVLGTFALEVAPADKKTKPKRLPFTRAVADFSQQRYEIRRAIDANPTAGWAISPQFGKKHVAIFETQKDVGFDKGTKLVFKMDQRFKSKKHNIGRFRLSVTTMKRPLNMKLLPDNIAKILNVPSDKRNQGQKNALSGYYRGLDSQLPKLRQALNEYQVPNSARALGAQDLSWALLNSKAFLFNH